MTVANEVACASHKMSRQEMSGGAFMKTSVDSCGCRRKSYLEELAKEVWFKSFV